MPPVSSVRFHVNVSPLKDLGHAIVPNPSSGYTGPKNMDPKIVKVLHDAFRKGAEDPAYLKALERYDMEPFYKSTEDYVKFAAELTEIGRQEVETAGLTKKS